MKTFLSLILMTVTLTIGNAFAHCKTKAVVYSPVVYGAPVTYQVYNVCPCSGTWGSPTCNCPDTYVEKTSCSSCGIVERQYNYVPGHWHGTQYEVFYDTAGVYPTPYAYHEDWAYTVDP
jgi:hypothetical protein